MPGLPTPMNPSRDFDQAAKLTFDAIVTLLDDLYRHRRYPHEADPTLGSRIDALVHQLRDRVTAAAGAVSEVREPANMDSYYLLSWRLRPGLSPKRYLTARVCHFAPLVELSWLELGREEGLPYRRSAELLDPNVLRANPKAEAVALAALQAAEELGLEHLPWEFLRSPARPDWPRQFWMPEQPEIRNYLFPGFFETWPEPERQ